MGAITAYSYSFYNERVDLEQYLYDLVNTGKKKSYFFVCTVNGDGSNFKQRSFHKSEIDKAITYIRKQKNKRVFVPTVLFDNRERTEESIGQIRKILIDLDLYKSAKYKDMDPALVVEDIQSKYFATGKIPEANAITYSGGGLYLEYHLDFTPGGAVLAKRRVIAKILFEMLKEYGPDAKSLDAPHVFGLADTINWKHGSNAVVRSYKNDLPNYSLAELGRKLPNLWDVWKKSKKIKVEKDSKRSKTNGNTSAKVFPIHKERTLAYDHIVSIKQLIVVREYDMTGYREMTIFFIRNAYHKMHQKRFYEGDTTLFEESLELAYEINKMFTEPLTDEEIEEGTLNKKKLYRFKTETIIDWFDITLDEQIQLKVKTADAKREKSKRQMRELRGSVSREEYDQKRSDDKTHLLSMLKRHLERNPKIKGKDLAELMGVTPARISQLKKELREKN